MQGYELKVTGTNCVIALKKHHLASFNKAIGKKKVFIILKT